MIDTCIEAKLVGDEAALLRAAGDPERIASLDFGDLPDYRPDGAGGRRNDDSLPSLWLTDFEKADIGGHPRHTEGTERRRDRRRRWIELAQSRAMPPARGLLLCRSCADQHGQPRRKAFTAREKQTSTTPTRPRPRGSPMPWSQGRPRTSHGRWPRRWQSCSPCRWRQRREWRAPHALGSEYQG